MTRRASRRREAGTALILNLFAMVLFASLATVVFVGARSQVKTTVMVERQAQAQAIAEAGLEDAMHSLYVNATWRTGFVNKAFAGGMYTVTLTTGTPTRITSTGYSQSVMLFGRAVRTVSAMATFTAGSCPYALMANKGILLEGKVDAYDPLVSLTPPATGFTTGANVWNSGNGNVDVSGGAACPPARIRGIAYYGAGSGYTGSASCAENGVVASTQSQTLPSYTCPGCPNLGNVTIDSTSPLTLSSGTYSYQKITIKNGGVLTLDTSSGTINLNISTNFSTTAGCQINNTSKIPSRVHLADISNGAGHTIDLNCSTPLHAYIESNDARFNINQEVYGHFCGGKVDVSSTTGAVGMVHYDLGGGMVTHVTASSWQESFARQ